MKYAPLWTHERRRWWNFTLCSHSQLSVADECQCTVRGRKELIMCVRACECEHMPVCVIVCASLDRMSNAETPADWSLSDGLAAGFLPGLQRSMQGNCAGLSGPESNHSDAAAALTHAQRLDRNAWSVLQKRSFSRLLPYCNYFNWAIALIGWGKSPAASTFIGCLDTSVLPPIGCLEESGRRAHPILPLWQSV